ncbi:hypothetical protein [Azospirillum picis]|uniref:Uncharacterized protein n=1 Tax=Azospirillum picis TaxID=488438 RepID=A0ABU0MEG5_9PROT|nr:hypothetical protein [Azospirillum picis]MBP2297985.1 hypothetical protein [Azospirillum picis]MDQ0531823.1 hypothetical protein [Azospirillum picis]
MVTPLLSIKTNRFPLNWKRYSKLYDELEAAAQAFYDLGHADLAEGIDKVRTELKNAWELIAAKERAERDAAERSQPEGH